MAPPATQIQLCGRLRVDVLGDPRVDALRGRQGRALFAHLAWHRDRPVRRDELIEALWAGGGPPPRETALAPVLSRLRAALAPGTIAGRDELALVLPEPVWVDVEAARALLDDARAREGGGALAAAREAARLVEAGLLPGIEAPWLDGPRAEVADLHVEALELAARAGLGVDAPVAEECARAAVAAAPFRESARAALMEVLRARGNLAEALRVYEELRVLLRDELGTVPGPMLVAVHDRVLAGSPVAVPTQVPAPAPAGLLERERELGALDAALARLATGQGQLLLLEGPAGVGKTRLLSELRARATAAGARTLTARASVLERDFGFGVVRQLLEGAQEDAFADAADPARAVLGDGDDGGAGADRSYAALHALFRLTATLAGQGPLVLLVDDLQWSDLASLRFVAYLVRRLDDLGVLVAATVRSGEPATDEQLMAELAHEPTAEGIRPPPLSAAGTHAMVQARLGDEVDPAFAAACHTVTGGNPLLLGQLLSALAAERVTPDAGHAEAVRGIGRRAVGRTVLLRLARLPEAAVAVAQGVAVLGEQPDTAALAALVERDEWAVADAVGALARADILRDESPVGFVHPLVRDAVYTEMPAARRGLEHGRAARVLDELGASPEAVAAQLARAPRRGDAWAVQRLREAARMARGRGAPESAVAHLERARAEPPAPEQLAAVAAELGEVSAMVRGSAAATHLAEAYELAADPVARAEIAIRLSRLLLFLDDPSAAPRLATAAATALGPDHDDLRQGLEAIELVSVLFGLGDPAALARLVDVACEERGQGPGARSLLAMVALDTAMASGPAHEASAIARVALHDDLLVAWDPVLMTVAAVQVLALGDPAEGVAAWRHVAAVTEQRGSPLDVVAYSLWGGQALTWAGDLVAAEQWLDRAYEHQRLWGMVLNAENGYSPAFAAIIRLERGDLDGARAALARGGADAGQGVSDGARFWSMAQAELLLAEGRPAEVLAITETLRAGRPAQTHPLWSPWRGLQARALAALGDLAAARSAAEDELALARRTQAPWLIGRGLRLLGELDGDREVLEQAAALLAQTSARLEHAKTLAALAGARAAAGESGAADAARQEAVRLATTSGADGLAARLAGGAP